MLIVEQLSDIVLNDSAFSVLLEDSYGLKVPVWKMFATDSIATIYSG